MVSPLFDGPIPGQSLTQEVGASQFEHPPQFADVNDSLEYIFEKLTQPRQVTRLVLMLKKEVPVEYIARTILFQGFSNGQWTPDSALLMLKIVMSMIIAIGVQKGIKPKIFNPDKSQQEFLDNFLDMADQAPVSQDMSQPQSTPQFTGLLGAQL